MHEIFHSVYRIYGRILLGCAWVAGFSAFSIMFLVVANSVARKLFNTPLPASIEITQSLLVPLIILPFAFTLIRREHVSTVFLTSKLQDSTRRRLYLCWMLLGFLLFCAVTYGSYLYGIRSYRMNELTWGATIQFPVWPAKLVVSVGALLICLQFLIEAVGTLLIDDFHNSNAGKAESDTHV